MIRGSGGELFLASGVALAPRGISRGADATPLAHQTKTAAARRRKRLIHCTRLRCYGCTRQGLTRFTTTPLRGSPPGASPRTVESGAALPRGFRLLDLRSGRDDYFPGLDRYLADQHRLFRAVAVADVLVVDDRRLQMYFTRDLQPLHHFSEDRVVAVEERGFREVNIELAGRAARLGAVASANGPLFVRDLVVELRLQPVTDAAVTEVAGTQRATRLDLVEIEGRVGGFLVNDAVEAKAVVVAGPCQGNEIADVVGRPFVVQLDDDLAVRGLDEGGVLDRLAVGRREADAAPEGLHVRKKFVDRLIADGRIRRPLDALG